jgi:hypothetical protein
MATIDFDLCAEFPVARLSSRPAVSTPDGSPIVRSRDIVERELRVFKLEWSDMPRQLLKRLRYLWAQTGGSVLAMDFTPPDESEIEVRFRQGTLHYEVMNGVKVSLQVELEEVR